MTAPVLVLGALPRIAVTVARSLARRGIPVDVAAVSPEEPAIRSRAVRHFVRLPDSRRQPQRFTAALLDLVERHGHDMVVAANDQGLTAIADHLDALPPSVRRGAPPVEAIRSVLDKARTLDVARCRGIAVPAAYDLPDAASAERAAADLRFPLVAKPRSKERSHADKVRYLAGAAELRAAYAADPDFGTEYLLQEYCPGEGVGVEVMMAAGEPAAVFQHRRVQEYPATGGVSAVAVAEAPSPALVEAAVTLLRALAWEGPAMVEFKVDGRGDAVLMEVNGRYWGSLALPVQDGVDFPLYHWQRAHGEPIGPVAAPRPGARMRWLAGDVRCLHAALLAARRDRGARRRFLAEAARFVRDFFPPTRDALWSWRDPRPGLAELVQTLLQLARADARQLRLAAGPRPLPASQAIGVTRSAGR